MRDRCARCTLVGFVRIPDVDRRPYRSSTSWRLAIMKVLLLHGWHSAPASGTPGAAVNRAAGVRPISGFFLALSRSASFNRDYATAIANPVPRCHLSYHGSRIRSSGRRPRRSGPRTALERPGGRWQW
jgi:hypothetical protein